jgi:hypothetical protein
MGGHGTEAVAVKLSRISDFDARDTDARWTVRAPERQGGPFGNAPKDLP